MDTGVTQVELAARLGITQSMLSAYETGKRTVSYDLALSVAKALGVPSDELLSTNGPSADRAALEARLDAAFEAMKGAILAALESC